MYAAVTFWSRPDSIAARSGQSASDVPRPIEVQGRGQAIVQCKFHAPLRAGLRGFNPKDRQTVQKGKKKKETEHIFLYARVTHRSYRRLDLSSDFLRRLSNSNLKVKGKMKQKVVVYLEL